MFLLLDNQLISSTCYADLKGTLASKYALTATCGPQPADTATVKIPSTIVKEFSMYKLVTKAIWGITCLRNAAKMHYQVFSKERK